MIQESFPSSFINKTEHRCFKDWSKLKSVPLYTLNIEIKEEKMRTFIDFIKYKTNLAGSIKLKPAFRESVIVISIPERKDM